MARRKASTATRPPDSFMKAYEAEGRQIIEGAIASEQESAEGFKVGDRVYVNQSPQSPWVILKIDGAIAHLKRLSSGFENTWLISELCPWEFKYYPEQWVKVKHETYPVVIEKADHFKTEPDDGVRYYKVLAAPWLGTDEERLIAQSAIEYEVLKPDWLDLDDGDMVIAELEAGSYMPGIIADAYSHVDTVEAKVLWDSGITSKIQMQELLPFASDWRVGDRVTEDINSENAYKEGWASERNRTHGTIVRFVKNSGKFYPQIRNADGALQTVNPECLKPYEGDEPLPEPESSEPPMTVEQVVAEMDRALQGGAEPTEGFEVNEPANTHELAKSDPLTTLAANIKAAHTDCEQALTVALSAESSALEHAKRAGELLTQAKATNGHGGWEAWRTEHTGIPSSTASLYQRIAQHWDELQAARVSSLKGADRYFREAKKLKSAADKPETKSATVGDLSGQEQEADRAAAASEERSSEQAQSAIPPEASSSQQQGSKTDGTKESQPVGADARTAAERFILRFGEGLPMTAIAIKLLSWCSEGELEAIASWISARREEG